MYGDENDMDTNMEDREVIEAVEDIVDMHGVGDVHATQ